jgi:DNA-binding beta-propeller fold protein YncE
MKNGPLRHIGYVDLPAHNGKGAFDHAAVHAASRQVYVAHPANDAVDVIDPASGRHVFSIPDLPGVAGVLVSDEGNLVITSNRAENTIGIFVPGPRPEVTKIPVGLRPNGVAYDPSRRTILAANIGDPDIPGSHTLSLVSLDERTMKSEIAVPGSTRWALYDPDAQVFCINISSPSQITVVNARNPTSMVQAFEVPSAGAHGLDLDISTRRLFCACDSAELLTLDARSGGVLNRNPLSGRPDVVFFNRARQQLYVAVGDPGVIDVFDTATMKSLGHIPTEKGAHTTALAPTGDRLYAFLPTTHRAAVYEVTDATS